MQSRHCSVATLFAAFTIIATSVALISKRCKRQAQSQAEVVLAQQTWEWEGGAILPPEVAKLLV